MRATNREVREKVISSIMENVEEQIQKLHNAKKIEDNPEKYKDIVILLTACRKLRRNLCIIKRCKGYSQC